MRNLPAVAIQEMTKANGINHIFNCWWVKAVPFQENTLVALVGGNEMICSLNRVGPSRSANIYSIWCGRIH